MKTYSEGGEYSLSFTLPKNSIFFTKKTKKSWVEKNITKKTSAKQNNKEDNDNNDNIHLLLNIFIGAGGFWIFLIIISALSNGKKEKSISSDTFKNISPILFANISGKFNKKNLFIANLLSLAEKGWCVIRTAEDYLFIEIIKKDKTEKLSFNEQHALNILNKLYHSMNSQLSNEQKDYIRKAYDKNCEGKLIAINTAKPGSNDIAFFMNSNTKLGRFLGNKSWLDGQCFALEKMSDWGWAAVIGTWIALFNKEKINNFILEKGNLDLLNLFQEIHLDHWMVGAIFITLGLIVLNSFFGINELCGERLPTWVGQILISSAITLLIWWQTHMALPLDYVAGFIITHIIAKNIIRKLASGRKTLFNKIELINKTLQNLNKQKLSKEITTKLAIFAMIKGQSKKFDENLHDFCKNPDVYINGFGQSTSLKAKNALEALVK